MPLDGVAEALPGLVQDSSPQLVVDLETPLPANEARRVAEAVVYETMQNRLALGEELYVDTAPGRIWTNWNVTASSATTTGSNAWYNAATSNSIWGGWVAGQTSTLTINYPAISYTDANTATITWAHWTGEQDARNQARLRVRAYDVPPRVRAQPSPETAEQRAARAAREELQRQEYVRQEAARRERRAMAIGRADKLLESVLTGVQRSQLEKNDWFLLRGQSGRIYRIRKGRAANVDLVDEKTGKVIDVLCAYPRMDVPDGDCMVAQKLMLEADEGAFLKIALKHPARGEVPVKAIQALLH